MRTIDRAESLNSDQTFTINSDERIQAGIDGQMVDLLVWLDGLQNNSTCATATFAASQLCAFQIISWTEPVKKDPVGVGVFHNSGTPIDEEVDVGGSIGWCYQIGKSLDGAF